MNAANEEKPVLPPGDEAAWSIDQVALFLGVSASLVRKLEGSGALPALPRIGRRVTFAPAIVREFRSNPKAFKNPTRRAS